MKKIRLKSKLVPIAMSVMGFVFLGLSFVYHENSILLSVGLVCLAMKTIAIFFFQPTDQQQESPLFAGLFMLFLVLLAFGVGFLKASKFVL